MSKYKDSKYIVVDLETTGLDPFKGCEIIEIGITEIIDGKIGRNYSKLVKPKGRISSFITDLTGIDNNMVRDKESIEVVLPKFRKYISDTTIIAHNAKFDVKFLNYYLNLLNLKPITNYICTMEMLKKCKSYKAKNKKLATACEYYGIVNENAHRANSDTLATAKLFLKIRDDVE